LEEIKKFFNIVASWLSWEVNAPFKKSNRDSGATTLGLMTLSIITLSIMTLSVMTLSIMTLSKYIPISILGKCPYPHTPKICLQVIKKYPN
jgi:hypothetical protein